MVPRTGGALLAGGAQLVIAAGPVLLRAPSGEALQPFHATHEEGQLFQQVAAAPSRQACAVIAATTRSSLCVCTTLPAGNGAGEARALVTPISGAGGAGRTVRGFVWHPHLEGVMCYYLVQEVGVGAAASLLAVTCLLPCWLCHTVRHCPT